MDLYYRDTLHYSRNCKADFVTMVRSVDIANTRNDQAHAPFDAAPLTWVGDQRHSWKDKGLDEAVRSAFRALELNYPSVSSDSGGYPGAPKAKGTMPRLLYLRWAQWNAMTPFFLIGGHDEHRPWKFDSEFFQTFRRYMWLHQELIPFFYSQHVQASLREGKLMHPGPGKHEYLIGDSILVAVMTDDQPKREVVFPDGEWLDYWNNHTHFKGGTTVIVDVPEDRSPIFIKLGSIIPLDVVNDAVQHGSVQSKGWQTLDIYPGHTEHKGVAWDLQQFPPSALRDRRFISLIPSKNGIAIRLEAGPLQDTILRIWRTQSPKTVLIDGRTVARQLGQNDWEAAKHGWWYDQADERLWIRLPGARDNQIVVEDVPATE